MRRSSAAFPSHRKRWTQRWLDSGKTTKNTRKCEAISRSGAQKWGITTEQYFDMVAEQLPRRMLRQRLRDTLGQEYCAQHGLEVTKVNPPEQMTKYVDQYLDNLLEAHRSEIKYY